ncbi:DUF3383 family protein [Orenia marismortui]|uniref:Uncharacterized protein DUF3383 n=1 Tax=Orenia marismortui TaxID=46469 RepID=A0A4R8GEU6_9FIRM|nr:DUF3383 family protein [Orenia marismortui]TDX43705.1 uncharacterized protein DUF3383 [Orenia marismortui]
MDEVLINIHDNTGAIAQKGFGLPLIFDPNNNLVYQEVTDISQISGVAAGDLAYDQANIILGQEPKPEKVAIYGFDISAVDATFTTIGEALDDLITRRNDWYWGVLASRVDADITAFSDWIASKAKVGAAQLDIAKTPTEIETFMAGMSNQRMAIFAHDGGIDTEDQFLAAGTVGRIAALVPGSYTVKFKTINTVASTTYQEADITTILNADCNTYVNNMGEDYISEGKLSNGDFIDTQVAKDWISARYREGIFKLLKDNEKIAFDDSGIAQVVSVIKSVNKQAASNGMVAQDGDGNYIMSVKYPRRADIPDNDRANRIVSGLKSSVTLAGAIHRAEVDFYLEI